MIQMMMTHDVPAEDAGADGDDGVGPAILDAHVRKENVSQPNCRPRSSIRERVLHRLNEDLIGADMQVSLFVAAAQSYRRETVLNPLPPWFDPDSDESIDELRHVINSTPDLKTLRNALRERQTLPESVIKLVHWIFFENPLQLRLTSLEKDHFCEMLETISLDSKLSGAASVSLKPSHIFKVTSKKTEKWERSKSVQDGEFYDCESLHGYHGSNLENFHSILSHGLQQHLNKNALYGEGTYISTDLPTSLLFSKTGKLWDKSIIAESVSCVVLCEFIADRQSVEYHSKDSKRNYVKESFGWKTPENYVIVRNNDVIKTSYLLIFSNKRKECTLEKEMKQRRTFVLQILKKHTFTFLVLAYILFLFGISLVNSFGVKKLLRKIGFSWDN